MSSLKKGFADWQYLSVFLIDDQCQRIHDGVMRCLSLFGNCSYVSTWHSITLWYRLFNEIWYFLDSHAISCYYAIMFKNTRPGPYPEPVGSIRYLHTLFQVHYYSIPPSGQCLQTVPSFEILFLRNVIHVSHLT